MALRTDTDHEHLTRAIELAGRGRGRVSPNPVVGAVVVRDGVVLGEGWHDELGGPHAEAILAAGIRRVVVGSDDPTEKASGRGLGILRDEGVEVDVAEGELAARARLLNQAFRKHARTGRPWILFKSAMTLDGKVATRTGDSKWISGEAARMRSHHWRAERDAVVVGIGTALADDPQLNARVEGVTRQPRRVVFDSEGRLPLDSQLVRGAPELPLTVVVGRAASRRHTDALEVAGAGGVGAPGGEEPARARPPPAPP